VTQNYSKSARRRARRARKAAERKAAENNQFAPFVTELEKVLTDGFEVAKLEDMLLCVRGCVQGARTDNRQLNVADLWGILEKASPNEPLPHDFKDVLSTLFESGGFDFSNPMQLFEKLAGSFNLNAGETNDVRKHVEALQQTLVNGRFATANARRIQLI
jgi:hypothetical protein